MDNELLLKPVIEIDDGEELKSFRMYYLFAFAFIFGLLPALVLCVRNCIWLRLKTSVIISLIAFSILSLAVQYYLLGTFFNENITQLVKQSDLRENTNIQQLLDNKKDVKTSQNADMNPAELRWKDLKSNIRLSDKGCSLILLGAAYFLTKRKYKVVVNLSGTIQPMLKWGIACVIAASILEKIISGVFFGGLL